MASTYCACAIANIEGLKCIRQPPRASLAPTIEDLDRRLRALEQRTPGLLPPPPCDQLTWNSLIWRIQQVTVRTTMASSSVLATSPAPIEPSIAFLRSTIAQIDADNPGYVTTADVDDENGNRDVDDNEPDEKSLNIVRQQLCRLAGAKNYQVKTTPDTLARICSIAMELSINIRKSSAVGCGPRVVPPPPPGWRNLPAASAKVCCDCHKARPTFPGRVISVPKKPVKKAPKKPLGFKGRAARMFNKMAWWKRKRGSHDSDSDSGSNSDSDSDSRSDSSSNGTSTVVDD